MTKKTFMVLSEEGDGSRIESVNAKSAVERYVKDYGVEADPGFKFYVFDADDPKDVATFEFTLAVVPSRAASSGEQKP